MRIQQEELELVVGEEEGLQILFSLAPAAVLTLIVVVVAVAVVLAHPQFHLLIFEQLNLRFL